MAYQVFISCKHGEGRDCELASELCGALQGIGAEVFFSDKDLSDANAMQEIYHALGEARILIVVGTNRDNMESKWVACEWSKFQSALLNDYKPDGEMIAYVEGIGAKDVPFVLNDKQLFDSSQKDDLVKCVKEKLGLPDIKEEEPPDDNRLGSLIVLILLTAAFLFLYYEYRDVI